MFDFLIFFRGRLLGGYFVEVGIDVQGYFGVVEDFTRNQINYVFALFVE